eukprot:6198445-Pleurochrysis_carterae.AAC.2
MGRIVLVVLGEGSDRTDLKCLLTARARLHICLDDSCAWSCPRYFMGSRRRLRAPSSGRRLASLRAGLKAALPRTKRAFAGWLILANSPLWAAVG